MASLAKEIAHTSAFDPTSARSSAVQQGLLPAHSFTISVVIPAKDEAENLPHVLPKLPFWIDEVLLVDGASTDGTVEVARRLRPDIRIIQQEGRGKGAALRSGFSAAKGDIIVMLDADGSTDPGEILCFVGALLAGADFAKGTRFIQGAGTADMTLLRKLGNRGLLFLVRRLYGGRYSDLCYGYNAFWRRVLPKLNLTSNGFEIETEMNIRALRANLKVAEVPSFEAERLFGTSHLNAWRDGWRVLRTILVEWRRPYRAAAIGTEDSQLERPAEHSLLYFDPRRGQLRLSPGSSVGWDGAERRAGDRRRGTQGNETWDGNERRKSEDRHQQDRAPAGVRLSMGGLSTSAEGMLLE